MDGVPTGDSAGERSGLRPGFGMLVPVSTIASLALSIAIGLPFGFLLFLPFVLMATAIVGLPLYMLAERHGQNRLPVAAVAGGVVGIAPGILLALSDPTRVDGRDLVYNLPLAVLGAICGCIFWFRQAAAIGLTPPERLARRGIGYWTLAWLLTVALLGAALLVFTARLPSPPV